METEAQSRKPIAIFMAFGTQGDVYPIAAICAAFAHDQKQYCVFLVTHSAHKNICSHLEESLVNFVSVESPPVLAVHENHDSTGLQESTFSLEKRNIMREHRQECYSAVGGILGHGPSMDDLCVLVVGSINLSKQFLHILVQEGWSLAELFSVRCVVAAPYVVPYSAPSSFERQFRKELPLLYNYLQEAPTNKVCWKDVMHWMWPLFTESWGSWRNDDLNLSPCPLTDPVTGLPTWHNWPPSPLLLYGFSGEIVEFPDYWPSNVRICGFWFLPCKWQFSCKKCGETLTHFSAESMVAKEGMCSTHIKLKSFLEDLVSAPPVFIGLSSSGRMGFMKNPRAFLHVIQTVLEITNYRFILFTAGYEPLDEVIQVIASGTSLNQRHDCNHGISLFNDRLFCFSGMIPYKWLFPRCLAAIHHGGSGSTAAALHAGIPQVICPFMLDQFYWAEKMHWLGVAPEPMKREHLVPDKLEDMRIRIAANVLARSITSALSPKIKARALEIAERISLEDGVMEAVKILKEEICLKNKSNKLHFLL